MRKVLIEVQIDWEDYDDVCDELIIEDAIKTEKEGVTWTVLPKLSAIKSSPLIEGRTKSNVKNNTQVKRLAPPPPPIKK